MLTIRGSERPPLGNRVNGHSYVRWGSGIVYLRDLYFIFRCFTLRRVIDRNSLILKGEENVRMDIKTQIKNSLISRIRNSNDLNFLKALQTIFDASEQSLYQLSLEQQHAIEQGREEIKNGKYVDNDQLMAEMKEWLSKK